MGTKTKMITVKALNGATATYDSKGNYIQFTNHVASVTIEQAKELLARPRHQYVAFDSKTNSLAARTGDPSIENLELEFIALYSSMQNLPALRNWLQEKTNIVAPALLNFQLEQSQQMVQNQNAVGPEEDFKVNPVSPQNFSNGDSTDDDLDAMPVDGNDEPENTLDRASRVLRESEDVDKQ